MNEDYPRIRGGTHAALGQPEFCQKPPIESTCNSRLCLAYNPGDHEVETSETQSELFWPLIESIVAGDQASAIEILDRSQSLINERARPSASRADSRTYFFDRIRHYIYEGDTALHMAAAASQTSIAAELVKRRADVKARNRRGAEPLHYGVDAGPGVPAWDPDAQSEIIALLIRSGADPNAVDKSGVAPLHRAVRNRCANAVQALIAGGANPRTPNGNGSTPLALATQNTGKSGSGSIEAKAQQRRILEILQDSAKA